MQELAKSVLWFGAINAGILFLGLQVLDQPQCLHQIPFLPSKAILMESVFEPEHGEDIQFVGPEPMPVITALVLRYSVPSADAELHEQYALGAAMMVFVWFAFCFGQLQQAPNDDEEGILRKNAQKTGALKAVTRSLSRVSSIHTTPDEEEVLESFNHLFDETCDDNAEQRNPYNCAPPKPLVAQPPCHSCATRLDASWRFCCACGAAVNYTTQELEGQHDPAEAAERHEKRGRTRLCEQPVLTCSQFRSEEPRIALEKGLKRSNSTGSIYSFKTAKSETVDDIGTTMIQEGNRFLFYVRPKSPGLVESPEELFPKDSIYSFKTAKNETVDDIGSTMIQKGNRFLFYACPKSPGLVESSEELDPKDSIYSFKTAKSEAVEDFGTPMIQNSYRVSCHVSPKSPQLVADSEELVLKDTFSIDKLVQPADEPEPAESSYKSTAEPEPAENPAKKYSQSDNIAFKFRKTDSVCIGSRFWPIGQMVSRYPPKWGHPYKKIIAAISPHHEGADEWIRASRWSRPSALPKRVKRAKVCVESGYFSYDASGSKGDHKTMHWHVNFAGNRLFSVGKGTLFNEDEVRALEHPCLASIAMAINDAKNHGVKGLSTLTHEPQVGPTPILIKGAQRRCEVNTRTLDPEFFADASEEEIRDVTTPCRIPMITNIVALPHVSAGTSKKYTVAQIRRLFIYAYTGFRAVVLESGGRKPVLHTGFWGCSSGLGGNKGLTTAIQILAAGTAGIKYIHFAPGDNSAFDRSAMWHGINVANALHEKTFADVVKFLVAVGYCWGNQGPSHLPYQPPTTNSCLWTN
jgi:Poly (ADP-ribose) glycohydrolase (PARG)